MKIVSPCSLVITLIFLPLAAQCSDAVSASPMLETVAPYQGDAREYVPNNSRENVSEPRYGAVEFATQAHVNEEASWSRLWE
ncbi:MAG: hypothetical protein ACI915_000352 [Gammaproteobacteria bacterium]|jgi:hypothetical protein